MVRTALATALLAALAGAQIGRFDRPNPSPLAARCGSAVEWRTDLDAARAEARRSGKPVFRYVPTLERSPMDRTAEIDRYMMAGPFADAGVIALLNAGFVPVRQAGARGEAGLRPREFIEPGFVVEAPDGAEVLRCQALATLHAEWFLARLRPLAGVAVPPRALPDLLREARAALGTGDAAAAAALLEGPRRSALAPAHRAEAGWLLGAALRATRRDALARAVWASVARELPDEPYAWKAAAEAEGHGPFVRGIEVLADLPRAAIEAPGTQAPAGCYDEAALWRRGAAFLIAMQDADGGYSDSRYDFGGSDSLPNVHFAITALVAAALGSAPDQDAAVAAAARAALEYVLDDAHLEPLDRDEIVWAHVYRIELLSPRAGDEARLRAALERSAAALLELQDRAGAWFHEYANPFVTASVLSALHGAQANAGVAAPPETIERGVRALLACRAKEGGFSYAQSRGRVAASVAGSACRMPRCELALAEWRGSRDDLLREAVLASFAHHGALEAVRKYDDHADAQGHGGFFFWYDMLGRTAAIARLADRDLAARQRALILSIPEIDGCFVDSHELGRVYGTASALLCLARLRALVE